MKLSSLFFSISALALCLQTTFADDRIVDRKVYFETTTESITHTGKDLNGSAADLALVSNQISSITIERCEIAEGDGSSSDWGGYFNVTQDKKAQALASAIRGVGIKTADKLVELNTFYNKPRSWSEFKDRIRDADAKVSTNLYAEVVSHYGSDNKRNLGYLIRSCRNIEDKEVIGRVSRRIHFVIQGAPLLSGESETLTISMKGSKDNQALYGVEASSHYNSYVVMAVNDNQFSGYSEILVRGTRNRVTPPNSLTAVITNTSTGSITIRNTAFDREITPTSGAKVKLVVTQTKGSWRSADTNEVKEVELNTTGPDTVINGLNMATQDGKHIVIHYSLSYSSSPYYNLQSSAEEQVSSK